MPIGGEHDAFHDLGHGIVDIPGRALLRIVSVATSAFGLLQAMMNPAQRSIILDGLWRFPNNPLSASEAALGVVKGAVDRVDAIEEARLNGVDLLRFEALERMTGNPPGPDTLIAEWRRGHITDADLDKGLRQGILKPEWIPFYRRLRHVPMTAETYVRSAVEGDLDMATAFQKASEQGLSHEDADLLFRVMGDVPGIQAILDLWHRKQITEAQVDDAIRDSHYKTRYSEMIKMTGEYWPPPRTTTTLLSHGAITSEEANRYFEAAGMSPELARAYTASALHTKTASHKELTVTQVGQLYTDHLITRDQALDDLARVGYGGPEATLLLDLADAKARQKIRQEAINGIRHVYLARRLDQAGAMADLAKFGVPADQQASLLELWELQRLTPSHVLTIGQLNQAFKKDIIDRAEFERRAVDLGYTPDDATILAQIDLGGADGTA